MLKSLPVLSTEPVLRKAAVDREEQFFDERYGCRQRDIIISMPLERLKRKLYLKKCCLLAHLSRRLEREISMA